MNHLHGASHQALDTCAPTLSKYGHALSPADTAMLVRRQAEALRKTGRVDFNGGILGPLALAFCDSPYIQPADWPDTLAELTALFYAFKNETCDRLGDDALIAAMAARFQALGGSLTALAATEPDWFSRFDTEGRWRDD